MFIVQFFVLSDNVKFAVGANKWLQFKMFTILMACVGAVLLFYMQEEEAFCALNTLIVDNAMHGLFIEGFPKLTRFLEHHDRIMSEIMRKLHQHFIKHNVDAILYSIKWFFVVFLERIPFSLSLRVWDIFLLEEFIEADIEKKIGRRRSEYTGTEKQVINDVILRQEQNAIEVQSNVSYNTSKCATGEFITKKYIKVLYRILHL
uniref:Rab-GAP TBC domain-containing protein n=1 Tax=Glossina palpalis gambiensis TaxID=67801 RepID=A0A1B0BG79_9MUSC